MTNEKIREIARRFTVPEVVGAKEWPMVYWEFCEEELIAFAQSVIEEERDITTIKVPTVVWDKLKDVNTVTDLINALKAAEKTE